MDLLQQKVDEIADAKTGKEPEETGESLFKKIKSEREAAEKATEEMIKEREKLQRAIADIALAGRSNAGVRPQVKTQADLDKEQADKIVSRFFK